MARSILKGIGAGAALGFLLFLILGNYGVAGGRGAFPIGIAAYLIVFMVLGGISAALWASGRNR